MTETPPGEGVRTGNGVLGSGVASGGVSVGATDGVAVMVAVAADGGGFNVSQMYVQRIPKSAHTGDEVLAYCGLGVDAIVARALSVLGLTG